MPESFDDPQVLLDTANKILEPESESPFSKPVEYTDTDGQVKLIPQGFKEVLDHIDSLPKNEDTINQIETFIVTYCCL